MESYEAVCVDVMAEELILIELAALKYYGCSDYFSAGYLDYFPPLDAPTPAPEIEELAPSPFFFGYLSFAPAQSPGGGRVRSTEFGTF